MDIRGNALEEVGQMVGKVLNKQKAQHFSRLLCIDENICRFLYFGDGVCLGIKCVRSSLMIWKTNTSIKYEPWIHFLKFGGLNYLWRNSRFVLRWLQPMPSFRYTNRNISKKKREFAFLAAIQRRLSRSVIACLGVVVNRPLRALYQRVIIRVILSRSHFFWHCCSYSCKWRKESRSVGKRFENFASKSFLAQSFTTL